MISSLDVKRSDNTNSLSQDYTSPENHNTPTDNSFYKHIVDTIVTDNNVDVLNKSNVVNHKMKTKTS